MPRVCPECGARLDEDVRRCPQDGTPTIHVSSEEALVGKVIDGRFTIRALIGVGGMGAVYRAHQHSMDREVAIKVLRPDLARNEQEVLRFFREARAASRLTSPYTITVYDFGQSDDGLLFLVMEYLRGSPLSEVLRDQKGPMDPGRATAIASQVLQALVHAHSMGILHRDLKPDNIFLIRDDDGRERVKVLDFGIAKMVGSDSGTLTATGMVVGTPAYMSPEQAMGRELDARCDLYAVGVILFEMLTGRLPHVADTPMALVYKKIGERAPLVREINPAAPISPALENAVACLLATRPEDRPASAREALDRLSDIPEYPKAKTAAALAQDETSALVPPGPLPEARPAESLSPAPRARPTPRLLPARWAWGAVLVMGLGVVVLVAWWLWRHSPQAPSVPGEPVAFSTGPLSRLDPARIPPPELPPALEGPVRRLLGSLRAGNEAEVENQIRAVVEARVAAKIANLETVGAAFLNRFSEVARNARPEDVVRLYRLAVGIAPDSPDLRFQLARAHFDGGLPGVLPGIRSLFAALGASFRNPPTALTIIGRTAEVVAWVVLILVVFVPVLLLVRYGPLLIHDIEDRFLAVRTGVMSMGSLRSRRLVDRLQFLGRGSPMAALLIVVVLWPLVAGFGLVPGLLIALLAVSVYALRSEVFLVAFTILLVAALFPVGVAVHLPVHMAAGPGARAWSCLLAECDAETRAAIQRDIEADPAARWSRIAFAVDILRFRADAPEALRQAENVLASAVTEDQSRMVMTLIGQVRLLRALSDCAGGGPNVGDLVAAERAFQTAAGIHVPSEDSSSGDWGASHALAGLAITERILLRREAAKAALARMESFGGDPSFFDQIPFEERSEDPCSLHAAVLRELPLPMPPAWMVYSSGTRVADVVPALPLTPLILGHVPAIALPFLASVAALALPVVVIVGRRRVLATRCIRCGTVSCRTCDLSAIGFDSCPTCVAESARPAFVDPADVVAWQRSRAWRREAWRYIEAIGSVLLPGAVQVLTGRPWTGVFLIGLLALGLGFIALAWVRMEGSAMAKARPGWPIPGMVCVAVAVVLSAVEARWRRP